MLTTTGVGDFSAATPVGHALAVIEMLTGQLYLVTVIGLLIGNFVPRPEDDVRRARHEKTPAPDELHAGDNKSWPKGNKS